MSKNNHRDKNPTPKKLLHYTRDLPKTVSGQKFVKRAGMIIKYTNYNKKGVTDKQEWV